MRIIWIIPGSGDAFYCENCLRDCALIDSLRALGLEVLMVPMYLPVNPENAPSSPPANLFFGGINVYLQQKARFFRRTPRWFNRLLDRPLLLKLAGGMSGMVRAGELKGTLLSMLQGRHGHQAKELDRLVAYLSGARADAVVLSNALLLGLAEPIKARLKLPVVCCLQDEDEFVEALDQAGQDEVWSLIRQKARDVDLFVAASRYYAQKMAGLLQLAADRFEVVYGGLELSHYSPAWAGPAARPGPPTIGFLSRRCCNKGPDLLAEAFCGLKAKPGLAQLKLRYAGGMLCGDRPLERQIRRLLRRRGVLDDVEFLPHLELPQRVAFLRSLWVLSVPERVGEAGGRYVKEAMACGVPVVQPQNGVFPELLAAAAGGLLFEPGNVQSLQRQLERILTEPQLAATLANNGRVGVAELFTARRAAQTLQQLLRKLCGPNSSLE